MYKIDLSIPHLPKMPNQLLGRHWRSKAKHATNWKTLINLHVGWRRPKKPLEKSNIIFTRHSSVEPDFDGLVGSFKAVQDALKKCSIIIDDKVSNINAKYIWKKTKPKHGFITINIEEIENDVA